jgi:hypothetical protein
LLYWTHLGLLDIQYCLVLIYSSGTSSSPKTRCARLHGQLRHYVMLKHDYRALLLYQSGRRSVPPAISEVLRTEAHHSHTLSFVYYDHHHHQQWLIAQQHCPEHFTQTNSSESTLGLQHLLGWSGKYSVKYIPWYPKHHYWSGLDKKTHKKIGMSTCRAKHRPSHQVIACPYHAGPRRR